MKNILIVLISIVIIGCSTRSPVTNTVDLTSRDFSNAKNLKEAEACEFYIIGFIGPFGNAQIFNAIKENNIKKVYAVDKYSANYIFVQERCVFVYGEEMTTKEIWENREITTKNSKRKKKKWEPKEKEKKKNDDKPWYSPLLFWGE